MFISVGRIFPVRTNQRFTLWAGDGGVWAAGRRDPERLRRDHMIRATLSDFLNIQVNKNVNIFDTVWCQARGGNGV